MPSSLIPEKSLVISPTLATTIGLEEAVMLQGLHDAMAYAQAEIKEGYKWFSFARREIEQRFPFWQAGDIQRIANNLKEKGVIVLGAENYLLSGTLQLALNEKVVAAVSSVSPTTPPASLPISSSAPTAPVVSEMPVAFANKPLPVKPLPAKTLPIAASTRPKKGRYKMYAEWQADKEIVKQLLKLGIPESFMSECSPEFIQYWQERDEAHHGWGSKFRSWIVRRWREEETLFSAQQQSTEISSQWAPGIDAVEILQRAGVDAQFIEEAIPEFILYWRERGDSTSTWNSKFVQHIRLQWARCTQDLQHESEASVMTQGWQPSPELYEVLQMATIDAEFARQQIPSFILYWQESGHLVRSWNSKFLQHVKYHWAKRHQMASKENQGFIERHTDKSWADGL